MMHYLIYKITNNINGKIYIGKHKTEDLDDGYMGSGQNIRRAIKKYGVENFTKEILYDVDDGELMDFIEELIVDEEFVKRKDTYNLRTGGYGGGEGGYFSEETRKKISSSLKGKPSPNKGKHLSEETKKKLSEINKGHPGYWKGKHISEKAKRKISEARKGKPTTLGRKRTPEERQHQSEVMRGRKAWNAGKKMSEEFKEKNREAQRKCQLGMHWYNNGVIQTRSKVCPDGFVEGRLYWKSVNKNE